MKVKKLNEAENFHNFPQRLVDLFNALNYEENSEGYVGRGMNMRSNDKTIQFSIEDEHLVCEHNSKILFCNR